MKISSLNLLKKAAASEVFTKTPASDLSSVTPQLQLPGEMMRHERVCASESAPHVHLPSFHTPKYRL